jgi:chromosome segregation ATPase
MLRLANLEIKELKESLRYVEMQLGSTKENLRQSEKRNQDLSMQMQQFLEQNAREQNIRHAQAQQIEEMDKRLQVVDKAAAEVEAKNRAKVQELQGLIQNGESEINKAKAETESLRQAAHLNQLQLESKSAECKDLDIEMEQKAAENNKLRKALAQMEATLHDLYRSRKGQGTYQIEIESLKSDNEYLLALLRETGEYADYEDADILKSAKTKALQGSRGLLET